MRHTSNQLHSVYYSQSIKHAYRLQKLCFTLFVKLIFHFWSTLYHWYMCRDRTRMTIFENGQMGTQLSLSLELRVFLFFHSCFFPFKKKISWFVINSCRHRGPGMFKMSVDPLGCGTTYYCLWSGTVYSFSKNVIRGLPIILVF